MDINNVKEDLQAMDIESTLREEEGEKFLSCKIVYPEIEQEIIMMVKIMDGMVMFSTVELMELRGEEEMKSALTLNDIMSLGKLFSSIELESEEGLPVDYGFEIPVDYYSKEMLELYVQTMNHNLVKIVFENME